MFFLTKGATGGYEATVEIRGYVPLWLGSRAFRARGLCYLFAVVALGMEARRDETHVVSEAQFTTARPVG